MRIYEKAVEQVEQVYSISGDNYHYLKNVVRVGIGEKLDILTEAALYSVEILSINKKYISVGVISSRGLLPTSYNFVVYQCVLKREYMDNVIEKYAELGVTKIVPVTSARSVGQVKEGTLRRYIEIAKAAALQSEQEFIPQICDFIRINSVEPEGDGILFFERGAVAGMPVIASSHVCMVVGPEGGFTNEEVDTLTRKGFKSYTPIKSILKAETAATVFAGHIRVQLETI